MQNIHKKWDINPMDQEPCSDDKSKIEIDEPKFIAYNNDVWIGEQGGIWHKNILL